ncbi:MAG: TfoX/Sxy family protein [Nitrospinales bacterium]
MAYDDKTADRVRNVLKRRKGFTERKMFGGIAFVFNGHMACGVNQKDLVLRLGEERTAKALRGEPYTRELDFTGKVLKSMVYVSPAGFNSNEKLRFWVDQAIAYVKTLPAK